ncbi:MAG TPA: cytochrome c, partial [Terriglobales bacterium]|nr:cytochrome c [Terriglobales bacterium]
WQRYQKAYYDEAARLAQNAAQRNWARSLRVEIKQLELNSAGGRVERCVTCHLAYDNPLFQNFPAPLHTHSSILKNHPVERFGCVVCHGGEGRAVTTLEAHGEGAVGAKPLLRGNYMEAACYGCHGASTLPAQATASVIRGRQLVNRYLCLACHKIDGEGGEEGPDLSRVGSHRSWIWIYAHTLRPQGVVPGSTMPVFWLNRDELRDITIYLTTLLDSRDQLKYLPLMAKNVARKLPEPPPATVEKPRTSDERKIARGIEFQYQGAALFAGAGCRVCHTIDTTGGEVGPALTYIGLKRNAENLEKLLKNPEDIIPGGKMPQLYLNDQQIKTLVRYLSARR